MRGSRLALAAAALAPAVALAQVSIGAAPEQGGTVLGRVCVDLDRDGRCGPGDVGIAGARVAGEGGAVALADATGRFHFFEVPGRVLARDRTAYGGHVVAVEGLGVRRAFELGPGGAVGVDLAVAPPPAAETVVLASAPGPIAPTRLPDGRLRWAIAGRTAPGAAVVIDGRPDPVIASADGTFAAEVLLASGENRFTGSISIRGSASLFAWTVHLVARRRGGELVLPGAPELIGTFSVAPAKGGGALVVGDVPRGLRLRAGPVVAGEGRVAAFLPPGTGPAEIVDASGAVVARGMLPLAPERGLRAAAAVAEVELALFGEPGVLVSGRGAASGRGRLGPVAYEAGVDLDDRDERLSDLARPRDLLVAEHALDPARTFPTAGDEGASDDRNPGRGRVWARLDADGARLDLGSARAGLTGSELGRYDRSLFGAKLAGEGGLGPLRLDAAAFGATLRTDANGNAPPLAAHDVLHASGGAAHWLSHGEIVPGSEALRIERRDPFTGRTLWQRALVRGVDYEIDWSAGRIVLAVPLASVGPPRLVETGDPFASSAALVLADYLHAAPGPAAEDLQGGRVGAALGPLALSAHGAHEERDGGAYRLAGASAQLDLGPALRVRAEAARTHGLLFARGPAQGFARSDDGLVFTPSAATAVDANALHLEADGGVGPVRAGGWWRERERGYSDAEFLEATSARERGGQVAVGRAGTGGTVRWAERRGADPRDPAGLVRLDATHLLARASWRGERLGLALEGVHAEREGDTPRAEETSAGVRASWSVDRGLTLDAGHHQKVRVAGAGIDPTFTSAGAALVERGSSLSVRGGWGPDLGPRLLVAGSRSAPGEAVYGTFGVDPDAPDVLGHPSSTLGARQRAGSVELFTEEQFERDLFGLRQARVLGASFAPLSGVQVSLSGERGQRLRLDGSMAARSAAAAAASLVRGPLRFGARGEVRDEGGDGHVAAGGSAEWLVAPGASLSARVSWTHGMSAGVEGLGFEASLGGAWRRRGLGALASGARVVELRPGGARRDGWVARAAGTAEAIARVELGVGAAIAIQEVADVRDDRLSGSARTRVRLAGPLDAAVEYARRAPLSGGRLGALDAVRAEAGLNARESRVALGYNLVGFGGDGLSPAADTGRVYLRAQLVY
jgi:hypothetical protein